LLLIKAGKDAGLKVTWYTYYAGALGSPSAIGKDGIGIVKQISEYHNNALPELDPDVAAFKKRFTGKDDEFGYYRLKTAFDMFAAATASTDSTAPTSSISSPSQGTTVSDGSAMTISGTATDATRHRASEAQCLSEARSALAIQPIEAHQPRR